MGLEFHEFYSKTDKSFINDFFHTQIYNIYTCVCGYDSYRFQKIIDIPLFLLVNNKKLDLINLLRNNFLNNSVEWNSEYINCKKSNQKHYKNIKINMINN